MSAKDLKALVRRLIEGWNKGKAANAAAHDELYANDVVVHRSNGEDIRGLENIKRLQSGSFDAFSDNYMTIEDMVVEGDKVAVRASWTGTNTGEYRGHPPTNRKVTGWEIDIYRVVNGKVVERWVRSDTLGFAQQLGLVPTLKKEK